MTYRRAAVVALMTLLVAAGHAAAQAKKSDAKSSSSADASAIIAQEKSLLDAVVKSDIAAFNKGLGSNFVYVDPAGAMRWDLSKSAEILKACTTTKATMENPEVTPVGSDILVLTYKSNADQTCGGKKAPPTSLAMSVWQKRGGRWVAVAHSETPPAPAK
jgi:ketosteroid isomerase-like protein